MLVVGVPYAVFNDGCIAKTKLVIFLDKLFLIGSPAFVGKLLGLEQR